MVGFERISTERAEKVHITKLSPEERRLVLEWKLGLRNESHSQLSRVLPHWDYYHHHPVSLYICKMSLSIHCAPSYANDKFPEVFTLVYSVIPKFSPIIFPFADI